MINALIGLAVLGAIAATVYLVGVLIFGEFDIRKWLP